MKKCRVYRIYQIKWRKNIFELLKDEAVIWLEQSQKDNQKSKESGDDPGRPRENLLE